MVDRQQLEELTRTVLMQLLGEDADGSTRSLVVFTGARAGISQALSELEALQREGNKFDLFFSQGAQETLDTQQIIGRLGPGRVCSSEAGSTPESLVQDYPALLVPAMSVATASRLACCMPDTPAARLVFAALLAGKPVVAARDGCCPDALGGNMAPGLKQQMRANLRTLVSFGVILTSADRLGGALRSIVQRRPGRGGGDPLRPGGTGRHVIGSAETACIPVGGTLRVPRGCMLTALAEDRARERGIVICRE